jgi:hypothetical protein
MGEMVYHGNGAMTVDRESGKIVGYWIDSMRGMYKGEGTREGNKVTLVWKGKDGTYKETMEKVSEDKIVSQFSFTDTQGKLADEGKSEMTRVDAAAEK